MPSHQRFYIHIELEPGHIAPPSLIEALVWHGAEEPRVDRDTIGFFVDAPSGDGAEATAVRRAASLVGSSHREAGFGNREIRTLSIQRYEPGGDTVPPTPTPSRISDDVDQTHDLAGVAELAALLRVSRQRVCQLARSGSFPAPVAQLASGPIWSTDHVRHFASSWDRRPGRRPR